MTTDRADKVHPVVEAMAKAISIARGGTAIGWPSHIREAKAAAKVLLSMEPTAKMKQEGVWSDVGTGVSVPDIWVAMTAAARSEMGLEG